jgi:hypothetical protein
MKNRLLFVVLSALSLVLGLVIYAAAREWNLVAFRALGLPPHSPFHSGMFPLPSIVKYSLPDGLWLFSGLLLLRTLWAENRRAFGVYRAVFVTLALLFELAQLAHITPGTFDAIDIIIMSAFCMTEGLLYKFCVRRNVV